MNDVLNSLVGGSMSEIRYREQSVRKSYSGSNRRGHDKLIKEFLWYQMLPRSVRLNRVRLFPKVDLRNGRNTTLYVEKLDRHTITKAIISGMLRDDAATWFQIALSVLFEHVYGMRMASVHKLITKGRHFDRVTLATSCFSTVPQLEIFFRSDYLTVNGTPVPSIRQFLKWLHSSNVTDVLEESRMFAIHGNLHFDNILIDLSQRPHPDHITFIDPRGDLLGPLHYDLAKMMTAAHSHYDEIHYNFYSLNELGSDGFQFSISDNFSATYRNLLDHAKKSIDTYSEYANTSYEKMLKASILCEMIHTYSFTYYHLNRKNPDLRRVTAYLLVFRCVGNIGRFWQFILFFSVLYLAHFLILLACFHGNLAINCSKNRKQYHNKWVEYE